MALLRLAVLLAAATLGRAGDGECRWAAQARCNERSACGIGFACADGRCTEAYTAGKGDPCTDRRTCASGLRCHVNITDMDSGYCAPPLAEGAECGRKQMRSSYLGYYDGCDLLGGYHCDADASGKGTCVQLFSVDLGQSARHYMSCKIGFEPVDGKCGFPDDCELSIHRWMNTSEDFLDLEMRFLKRCRKGCKVLGSDSCTKHLRQYLQEYYGGQPTNYRFVAYSKLDFLKCLKGTDGYGNTVPVSFSFDAMEVVFIATTCFTGVTAALMSFIVLCFCRPQKDALRKRGTVRMMRPSIYDEFVEDTGEELKL